MSRQRPVKTSAAPPPIGPYSQAVVADGMLYASGQIPLDPKSGEIVGEDVAGQTRQVLANLDAVLRAGGSSADGVVKVTVYLRDMADFPAMNEVYAAYFDGDVPPARSTIQASRRSPIAPTS